MAGLLFAKALVGAISRPKTAPGPSASLIKDFHAALKGAAPEAKCVLGRTPKEPAQR